MLSYFASSLVSSYLGFFLPWSWTVGVETCLAVCLTEFEHHNLLITIGQFIGSVEFGANDGIVV